MNRPLVYIAGPYTHPDPISNTRAACDQADELLSWGLAPIVPHLNLVWDLISTKPYQEWLELDLEMLARCDAVYRIPGVSKGADGEVAYAREHAIPVFTRLSDVVDWGCEWKARRGVE